MKIDGIPGLTIHEHEARFTGTVDMPPADLAAVDWNGRVMLVVTADIGAPFRVTTDKEDTNKAHWTYSVVDAAIVRDQGMREHLENALHVDAGGIEPHVLETHEAQSASRPAGMIGIYDKEGTFWGFQKEEEILPPVIVGDARAAVEIINVDGDENYLDESDGLVETYTRDRIPQARIVEVEAGETSPRKPMFGTPSPRPTPPNEIPDGPEVVERLTGPIRHKDARLDRFLNDDKDQGNI